MTNKWIVLLNYNLAARCIGHASQLSSLDELGVFVVDNASGSADFTALKQVVIELGGCVAESNDAVGNVPVVEEFVRGGGRLVLYRNGENLGYAGGNNTALKLLQPILGSGGQFLVMKPDVKITGEAAISLLRHAAEICGPAIYEHYMKGVSTFGHDVDFTTGFGTGRIGDGSRIACLSGACFKLSGAALDRYGFLPDENFLYGEEIKYFERVHRLGGAPVYVPEVTVEHIGSLTVGNRSFNYFYYIFRNRLTYFREVAGPRYRKHAQFACLYASWCLGVLYTNLKRRNWEGIRGILCGVRDGFRGVKGPRVG